MKAPVQWCFDMQDALTVRQVLYTSILDGQSLTCRRPQLRSACEKLHDLVIAFEEAGLTLEYETQYLCLFDALSHFTEALKFAAVDKQRLRLAAQQLDELYTIDLD